MKTSRRRFAAYLAGSAGAFALALPFVSRVRAVGPINVFMGTTLDFANIWIAKLNGFFEREGLPQVEIRLFPSGAAASDAFRTGEAHFLGCGDLPAVRMWKTIGSKYISPISRDFNFNVMVVKSTIKTPADLKGKIIATQTASANMFMVGLVNKKYGLQEGDYKVVNMEPTDMVIALSQGSIDGFVWSSPFDEKAKEIAGDKVTVLLRGGDVNYPNSVALSARKELIDQTPIRCKDLLRELAAASDWCMDHKDEVNKIVGARIGLPPQAKSTITHTNFRSTIDKSLYTYLFGLGKYMESRKLLDAPIDWNDYIDAQFLKNISAGRVEEMPTP